MRGSCRSRFRIYRTKQLDPQQLKPARPFAQDLSLSGTIHLVERSGNVPAGGAMSPFMTAFLGGLAGGASFALVLTLLLAIFGRPLAEGFFQQQVAFIEKRFMSASSTPSWVGSRAFSTRASASGRSRGGCWRSCS